MSMKSGRTKTSPPVRSSQSPPASTISPAMRSISSALSSRWRARLSPAGRFTQQWVQARLQRYVSSQLPSRGTCAMPSPSSSGRGRQGADRGKVLDEPFEIHRRLLGRDLVLIDDDVANLAQGTPPVEQLPDAGGHVVQRV